MLHYKITYIHANGDVDTVTATGPGRLTRRIKLLTDEGHMVVSVVLL